MHLTEPTRGTREFIRLRDKHIAELQAFTKPLRRAEKKRKAAIAAALTVPLTDKQRGQGRG